MRGFGFGEDEINGLYDGVRKYRKGKKSDTEFASEEMNLAGFSNSLTAVNNNGKTLKEYVDIIKEVCRYYSIPVLDMFNESGLFPFEDELALEYYTQQGPSGSYYYTHPNSNGQRKMGIRVSGYIKQLG